MKIKSSIGRNIIMYSSDYSPSELLVVKGEEGYVVRLDEDGTTPENEVLFTVDDLLEDPEDAQRVKDAAKTMRKFTNLLESHAEELYW